jgi:hypothetical protein
VFPAVLASSAFPALVAIKLKVSFSQAIKLKVRLSQVILEIERHIAQVQAEIRDMYAE